MGTTATTRETFAARFPQGVRPWRGWRRSPGRRGFSLVELIVVLLVLSIVAAVGSHGYAEALARHRAISTARRIAAEIDFIRHAARNRSLTVTVTFTSNGFTVSGLPSPDRPAGVYTLSTVDGALQASLSNINFGGGQTLVFNAFGMPDSGGVLTVRSGGYSTTVTVAAGTGAATVP